MPTGIYDRMKVKPNRGMFQEGHIPWLKGRHQTEEAIDKMRKAHKGAIHSEQTKEKIRKVRKGKTYNQIYGIEKGEKIKRKMSLVKKGKKLSEEHKKNLSKAHMGNPGYWKGKHLYKEVVKNISKRALEQMKNGKGLLGYGKTGKRKDLNNTFFRSRWEANYARYLNLLKIKWEYEPKTFWFKRIKRGTITYTPDFYLPIEDKFIEIKGWFTDKSKTKLKRFKKYYPEEFKKLILVVRDPWAEGKADIERMKFLEKLEIPLSRIESYKEIKNKLGGLIPNWE